MKAIIPDLDYRGSKPLYLQLYDYIKEAILNESIQPGEKLPSLRSLSKSLQLSLTTIELAYQQLLVEGYVRSKPQSGYYVNPIAKSNRGEASALKDLSEKSLWDAEEVLALSPGNMGYYDRTSFDFVKWKKCMNGILTDYSHLLLREGDPKGEESLRHEISRYVYASRGVSCTPQQIIIGAGTQQITNQLCTLLNKMNIRHVAVEDPGYLPVRNIFRDRNFAITTVAVGTEGIDVSKLPSNIPAAVYVSPSNQFPTGYVMPISRRHALLNWAADNNSIIIEDDYDSELRYFGKPIPSLQGLDTHQCVVYLGSFSSTLFPSIKISYMVLPHQMVDIFDTAIGDYTQTCSKTEQLTLAIYMKKGFYQTNIRKLRNLYAQKLQAVISSLKAYSGDFIQPVNSSSGINMLIHVKSAKSPTILCHEAQELGILVLPLSNYTQELSESSSTLIFYYNQIPLSDIPKAVRSLTEKWRL